MIWFEDVVVGEERALGEHAFTREAIIAFATAYDPQRFHVDEEAAKSSMFGGLCASGWHTAAAAMRCIVETRAAERAAYEAGGLKAPPLGVSPGVEALRWPTPVWPGDVIRYFNRVEAKRETQRSAWGLVTLTTWGVNGRDETVLTMTSRAFVARRGQS